MWTYDGITRTYLKKIQKKVQCFFFCYCYCVVTVNTICLLILFFLVLKKQKNVFGGEHPATNRNFLDLIQINKNWILRNFSGCSVSSKTTFIASAILAKDYPVFFGHHRFGGHSMGTIFTRIFQLLRQPQEFH